LASCSASGYEVVASYDARGFLTTATVPVGVSTGWDVRGFPTTAYPSNCQISNPPFAIGQVLGANTQSSTIGGDHVVTSSGNVIVAESSTAGLVTPTASRSAGVHGESITDARHMVMVCCTLVIALVLACFLA